MSGRYEIITEKDGFNFEPLGLKQLAIIPHCDIRKQNMKAKLNIPKIPILGIPDTPLSASSQEHLPISDICEDIVLSKTEVCRSCHGIRL